MAKKRKRKAPQDFVKKKRKVGKEKKKGDTLTFKSKAVVVPSQLETKLGLTTYRKQNFQVLLSQLNHHNSTVRHDALLGLREIFTSHPDQIFPKLARLVEQAFPSTVDLTTSVRQAALALVRIVTAKVSPDKISPFFPAMLALLRCGLTHINEDVQLNSVKLLEVYLEQYSVLVHGHSDKLLPLLTSLLSRQASSNDAKNPGKAKSSSQSIVSSRTLLKLDIRLTILELIMRLLLLELSHLQRLSSAGSCQDDGFTVDLRKPAAFSNSDDFSKVQNTSCQFSNGVPYLSILHSKHGIPLLSRTSEQVAISTTSPFDDFLDVVNVLVSLVMENWTEVTHSPSPHVAMMSKLVELLNIIVKLLDVLNSPGNSYGLENKKWMKVYLSAKNGISTYIFKQFPFFVTRNSSEDKWSLFEIKTNFMFCNVLVILCLMGKLVNDNDDRLMEFVNSTSDFLHTFKFQLLVANSSQTLLVITELTIEIVPQMCKLVDEGVDDTVAKKMMGFILRLYNDFCHPQSRCKQLLIRCLGKVFISKVITGNKVESSTVYTELLLPWSNSLLTLLSCGGSPSLETFSVVIEVMVTAVQHGNTTIVKELPNHMDSIFGQESYLRQASISTQRKALELLWYIPILEIDNIKILVDFASYKQLDVGVVQYLIQIIHHRFMWASNLNFIKENLSKYLHFMFTILLEWCDWEETPSSISMGEGLESSVRGTLNSDAEGSVKIQQTVCESIFSGPINTSDALHCLQATLRHRMKLSAMESNLDDREIDTKTKRLLRLKS